MARRSEHTQEQIREMVLSAAENIVIDEGFKALTVRKVALEIGYTVGSIYMVFTNMDDLIMHVKGRTLDELADELSEERPGTSTEEAIQDLADCYLRFAHKNFNRWRMIFEAINDVPAPDWYQQKVNDMFMIVEPRFQKLRPELSTEQVSQATRALWSGVHGICVLSLNGNLGRTGSEDAETTVRLLVQNFIRGWRQAE
ncbi:MAG: TetR/AcrR family transcriptional regulator [Gammaproteobacteria bacterium]